MGAVAAASGARSLAALQEALQRYAPQLGADPVVAAHLEALYDTLLERNLSRIIEPYSRVQLAHVAALIALPPADVERKLSQMILDKKVAGTLDQGNGCLVVFDDAPEDGVYAGALETIANLGRVVDSLAAKSAGGGAPVAARG